MTILKKYLYLIFGSYIALVFTVTKFINNINVLNFLTFLSVIVFILMFYLMDKWEMYGVNSINTTKKTFRIYMSIILGIMLALLFYSNFIK